MTITGPVASTGDDAFPVGVTAPNLVLEEGQTIDPGIATTTLTFTVAGAEVPYLVPANDEDFVGNLSFVMDDDDDPIDSFDIGVGITATAAINQATTTELATVVVTLAGTVTALTPGVLPATIQFGLFQERGEEVTTGEGDIPYYTAVASFTLRTIARPPFAINTVTVPTMHAGSPITDITLSAVGAHDIATWTMSGVLPLGLVFTSNSDGTATISGIPTTPGTTQAQFGATSTRTALMLPALTAATPPITFTVIPAPPAAPPTITPLVTTIQMSVTDTTQDVEFTLGGAPIPSIVVGDILNSEPAVATVTVSGSTVTVTRVASPAAGEQETTVITVPVTTSQGTASAVIIVVVTGDDVAGGTGYRWGIPYSTVVPQPAVGTEGQLPAGLVGRTVHTGARTGGQANQRFDVYIPARFLTWNPPLAYTPTVTMTLTGGATWARGNNVNDPFRIGTTAADVLEVGDTVVINSGANAPFFSMTLVSPTVIQIARFPNDVQGNNLIGDVAAWAPYTGLVVPMWVNLTGTGTSEIAVSFTGGSTGIMPQPTVVSLTGPTTQPGFTTPQRLNGAATTPAGVVVAGGQSTSMIPNGARSILIYEATPRALSATGLGATNEGNTNLLRGITFTLPGAFVFTPPPQPTEEGADPTWIRVFALGINDFLTHVPRNAAGDQVADIFPSQRAAIEAILVEAGVIPANSQAGMHNSPLILRRPASHPQAAQINVPEGPLQQITFNNAGIATNLMSVFQSTAATGGQLWAARDVLVGARYAFFSHPATATGAIGNSTINVITHGIVDADYNLAPHQRASVVLGNFGVGHANPVSPTFPGEVAVNVGLRAIAGNLGGYNPAPVVIADFRDQAVTFTRVPANPTAMIAGRTYDEHAPFDPETSRTEPSAHEHFAPTPNLRLQDTVGWAGGVGAHGANIGVALFPWTFTVTDAEGNPHPYARLAGVRLNTNYDADAPNARGFDNDIFHNVFGSPSDTWLTPDSDNTEDRFTVIFGPNGHDVMVANLAHPTQGQIILNAWFYLSTAPNFEGAVYVTASNGQGQGGIVHAANVTPPITVSTATNPVQFSHARLPVSDIIITENMEGALRAVAGGSTGVLQVAINELPFTALAGATGGVNGFWPVNPNNILITGNAGVVENQVLLAPATTVGIQPYIAMTVQRESVGEGSTITLRNLEVALHNLGIGEYDLLVFGSAISDNGPEINTGLHSGMPGFRRYAFQGFVHPAYLDVGVIIDDGMTPDRRESVTVEVGFTPSTTIVRNGVSHALLDHAGQPIGTINRDLGDGRGMLAAPLRAFVYAFNGSVVDTLGHDADGNFRFATIIPGAPNERVYWTIGVSSVTTQGWTNRPIPYAPFIENSSAFIPLRGFTYAHGLGLEVGATNAIFTLDR
jgi:hypothetical protein